VHGRAGALAVGALGPVSVAAADVAEHLPAAFGELVPEGSGGRGPVDPEGVPRSAGPQGPRGSRGPRGGPPVGPGPVDPEGSS